MKRILATIAALTAMLATTVVYSTAPASAAQPTSFPSSVSVNATHACALDQSGNAYCWGRNADGQLGNGTSTDSPTPVAVSGGFVFKSIYTSTFNSCALTAAGAAYCWGAAGGINGDGTGSKRTTPVAVTGGYTFQSLSGSYTYMCGLTTAGGGLCWGSNNNGEFGNGTKLSTNAPTPINGGNTWLAISTGENFGCALNTAHNAYCWGANPSNQLGDGSGVNSLTPVAISTGLTFDSISSGGGYTCAVTSSGDAYCWGSTSGNQLGNGASTGTPTIVSGGLKYKSVATSYGAACGLLTNDTISCWGQGFFWYQLGDGYNSNRAAPGPINGGRTYTQLRTSSEGRGFCAITTSGPMYCWGQNDSAQLGVYDKTPHLYPVQTWWISATSSATAAVTVDPTLSFSVAGRASACNGVAVTGIASATAVDLGHVAVGSPGSAAQDLTVTSNGAGGYVVYQKGSPLIGPRALADVSGTNASPGAFAGGEGFGYTTDDSDLAGFAGPMWAALSATPMPVMTRASGVAIPNESNCIAYRVAVGTNTPSGAYTTTVIYTAVPTF